MPSGNEYPGSEKVADDAAGKKTDQQLNNQDSTNKGITKIRNKNKNNQNNKKKNKKK